MAPGDTSACLVKLQDPLCSSALRASHRRGDGEDQDDHRSRYVAEVMVAHVCTDREHEVRDQAHPCGDAQRRPHQTRNEAKDSGPQDSGQQWSLSGGTPTVR
jgi:hypothetical protein